MINVNKISKHSVIRMSNFNPDTNEYQSKRFIGSYETYREAKFIATKALKMEKASVMLSKIASDPSIEGKISVKNIFLADIKYAVVDAVIDTPTTNYFNGVSTIIHHLNESSPYEKRIEENSQNISMSFKDFVMARESSNKMQSLRSNFWTQDMINAYRS